MNRLLLTLILGLSCGGIMGKVLTFPGFEPEQRNEVEAWADRYLASYAEDDSLTARAKRSDFNKVFRFFRDAKVVELEQLTSRLFIRFCDSRLDAGEAVSTVRRRLATVKHWLKFIGRKNPSFDDCSAEIRPSFPKWRPVSKSLTPEEKATVRRSEVGGWKAIRDNLIVEMLLRAGLRRFEAAGLDGGQVDLGASLFRRVRRKSHHVEDVAFAPSVHAALQLWLPFRDQILEKRGAAALHPPGKNGSSQIRYPSLPLLVSSTRATADDPESFRLSTETIYQVVKRRSDGKASPHVLRHQFVKDALATSGDVQLTSQAAGHASVQTTMAYLEQPDAKRKALLDAIDKEDA